MGKAMSTRSRAVRLGALSFFASISFCLACTRAGLQPSPPPPTDTFDDRLEVRAEFCAPPADEVDLPIKILFVMDRSSSLECTDASNRRSTALRNAIDELASAAGTRTSPIFVARLGFSARTVVSDAFTPITSSTSLEPEPDPRDLSSGTDYQGALASALQFLERDMRATPSAIRARTRYRVVFLSDGQPAPSCHAGCEDDNIRCSNGVDDDGDGIIDGADPDCAGPPGPSTPVVYKDLNYPLLCNVDDPREVLDPDEFVDIEGRCPDYNQPYQIIERVEEITDLARVWTVAAVNVDTVLLFARPEDLNPLCAPLANQFDPTRARSILSAMAAAGGGVYREANSAGSTDYLNVNLGSLSAPNALVTSLGRNLHAIRGSSAIVPDSDGDGVSDDDEVARGLNPAHPDSDGDGYGDLVEVRRADRGFDARNPDRPAQRCADPSLDRDGDGLNDCTEELLGIIRVVNGTPTFFPDTDADGILDRDEVAFGTNPLVADSVADDDFDGLSNLAEVQVGLLPLSPDDDVDERDDLIGRSVTNLGARRIRGEERLCYDLRASNLTLMSVNREATARGLNRIVMYATTQPTFLESTPPRVFAACFESFYRGPTWKVPTSGLIDASSTGWDDLLIRIEVARSELASCPWFNGTADEASIRREVLECLPETVVLDRFAYHNSSSPQPTPMSSDGGIPFGTRALPELDDLIAEYLEADSIALCPEGAPDCGRPLPRRPYELFRELHRFDPERHCVRLWELERVLELLHQVRDFCTCQPVDVPHDGEGPLTSQCCEET